MLKVVFIASHRGTPSQKITHTDSYKQEWIALIPKCVRSIYEEQEHFDRRKRAYARQMKALNEMVFLWEKELPVDLMSYEIEWDYKCILVSEVLFPGGEIIVPIGNNFKHKSWRSIHELILWILENHEAIKLQNALISQDLKTAEIRFANWIKFMNLEAITKDNNRRRDFINEYGCSGVVVGLHKDDITLAKEYCHQMDIELGTGYEFELEDFGPYNDPPDFECYSTANIPF